jgi:hypothetical protein
MERVPARNSQPTVLGIGKEEDEPTANDQRSIASAKADIELNTVNKPFMAISLSLFSPEELRSLITDTTQRSIRIEEVAGLLRTLVSMGECQLSPGDCSKLTSSLDKLCGEPVVSPYNHYEALIKGHEKALAEAKATVEELEKSRKAAEEEAAKLKPSDAPKAPIKFKDAVGRKFSFPWHICKTWKVSLSTFNS